MDANRHEVCVCKSISYVGLRGRLASAEEIGSGEAVAAGKA